MGSHAGHAGQESSGELREVDFKVTLKQGGRALWFRCRQLTF